MTQHTPEAAAMYNRQQVEKKQEIIRRYKAARGCADCGESDPVVLQLDHRPGETINPRLRNGLRRHSLTRLSYPDLAAELEKCDVRCANCHLRRHSS